jgi:hypothetical protein
VGNVHVIEKLRFGSRSDGRIWHGCSMATWTVIDEQQASVVESGDNAVGYATCGEIGFDGRTEYTAIGTVVNLSARVCAIAAGGQILVTNKVMAAVDDRVESTPLGQTEFKGLTRPVPIHEITTLR